MGLVLGAASCPRRDSASRSDLRALARDAYTESGSTLSVRVSRDGERWGWRIEDAWDTTMATGARPMAGFHPVATTLKNDYRDRLFRALREEGKPVLE